MPWRPRSGVKGTLAVLNRLSRGTTHWVGSCILVIGASRAIAIEVGCGVPAHPLLSRQTRLS